MKKIFTAVLLLLVAGAGFACTTFCINKDGQIIFGRNYDWITGAGIVNTNLRGLVKTSVKNNDAKTISWISKYGSITFNQYGKEFPTGGMNENGLVVELMWLDGTRYPGKDARPSVSVLQWIQYQLDNSSTVEDVINTDAKLRIEDRGTPLHYLVADAKGNVATIEFLKGKMVVHTGNSLPFPVLTNNTYDESLQAEKDFEKNKSGIPPSDNSLGRFVKACNMIQQLNANNISTPLTDFAFSVLDQVSQGSYTKWSIVYDISKKEIYFKTADNAGIKIIRFSGFDFSCVGSYTMFNMNQHGEGDVTTKFILPDKNIKRSILHQAIEESRANVAITAKEEEGLMTYEDSIKCK